MDIIRKNSKVILFLLKFLGVYFLGNIIYGIWIESFNYADPATYSVSRQTEFFLDFIYDDVNIEYATNEPNVWMSIGNRTVVNVFEGCNGINVMILFVAFIIAYKGPLKITVIFSLVGLIIIHLANIFRLVILFIVAEEIPQYLFFTHKYLFTAIIYSAVFLMWYLWIKKYSSLAVNASDK